jgi:Protein of unknown function (DUF2865)
MVPSVLIGTLFGGVRRTVLLCVPAVLLLAVPSPGHAQSFFETLFGGSQKPASAPNFSAPPQRLAPLGLPSAQSSGGQFNPGFSLSNRPKAANSNDAGSSRARRDEDDDEPRSKDGKGAHRTVCVRLCDGYYWPVNHGVNRSQFRKDARSCEASCNGDAKLFHMPSNGEIGDAVDQSGKPYSRLPAAFLYRKKLVAGCACRPEAWSDAEMSRHQVYAFNEAQEKARKAEEEAAEEARVAAAEAAKVAAEQRMAEAKLTGKAGVKSKKGQANGPGPSTGQKADTPDAEPATTEPATTSDDAVIGAATVASATLSPSTPASTDVAATPSAPRKSRSRQIREFASVVEVRPTQAAPSAPARSGRTQQPNVRPQPTYASASPQSGAGLGGLFAKKHTWPGD